MKIYLDCKLSSTDKDINFNLIALCITLKYSELKVKKH